MKKGRNLLKNIAGVGALGTVLPNAWIKPLVNSASLPVHAQMSEVSTVIHE